MTNLFNILLALAIALIGGFGSAYMTVANDSALPEIKVATWTGHVAATSRTANPYTKAILSRSAAVPLSATEAISFATKTDADGNPLRGGCTYRLMGQELAARWWTLTVTGIDGQLVNNSAQRQTMNNMEILRAADGAFQITLAPQAHAGNWLPSPASGRIRLLLNLYDTALFTDGSLAELILPRIQEVDCP